MRTIALLSATLVHLLCVQRGVCDEYDPLRTSPSVVVETLDMVILDANRGREIPIRCYLPSSQADAKSAPYPVLLFSHGLGGSRAGSAYLGKHWASRGYVAVFLQHPGSDESVWKDQPLLSRMSALREAASTKNFMLRAQDVKVVLDQLELWNSDPDHALHGRMDTKNVGMSGHSFGGQTTQAVSGQSFPLVGQRLTDKRITAAIVMSPSAPERGSIDQAFGSVSIPWMLMTGTHDTAAVGTQTPESRRRVFPALSPGDKFELVLNRAEHSAFTDRALPGDKEPRNPNHHRAILALSTAFWDAFLNENETAKAWLTGPGAQGVLESSDLWSRK
ncbi:MAG: dienelactone hydrolase [Pirellula sp.]|nr:dienelactone hydrolase [Pirellula sp.]